MAYPGSALEIGCGTGLFLIPFCKEGLDVSGIDISRDMLVYCREEAEKQNITPKLYHASMETMKLNRSFATLYIPSCSFMHILDPHQAQEAIVRFREHLQPRGQLLISLFVSYGQSSDFNLVDEQLLDGKRVVLERSTVMDHSQKLQTNLYRFTYEDSAISYESFALTWRLYSIVDVIRMLESAGFSEITLFSDYTHSPPDESSEIVIVRAVLP